ncbi:hypothetical protein JET18_06860 [Chryseobacterium sp. L7]|uniref:Phosphatidate cytidylyltransferase n=1 Tax=Chryseobacterium endalhagicum TaxID=2797638 RepID=A0ABS1QD67_9FLAO|nr:hypothetical protein [Chryseobacterium endalhagicum]MBL1220552.1 hypothetical protein [Chryseobacterium endalhagicum]
MKQNNFSSLRELFLCSVLSIFLLISCSSTSATNESDAIKITFLVTCGTIAAIFIIFYISKKLKR